MTTTKFTVARPLSAHLFAVLDRRLVGAGVRGVTLPVPRAGRLVVVDAVRG